MKPALYIGLISGTSMDAVDCALVDFSAAQPVLLDFLNIDIPAQLKAKIMSLCTDGKNQVHTLGETDIEVARLFSQAALNIIKRNKLSAEQITAIGSHGQTIRHQPPQHSSSTAFTLQIGDPNTISELTAITTIADFRRHDVAAGGQGAPLTPAFHLELFKSSDHDRIILNIGGMSNITLLNRNEGLISGYDTGPGNVLMDLWVKQNQNRAFDDNGEWAKNGTSNQQLLDLFLTEPFFHTAPPKSTGRELFNQPWLNQKLSQLNQALAPADVQATLAELTATSISDSITEHMQSGEIIVCGGGARNGHLLDCLRRKLDDFHICTSTALGIDGDSIEAMAFAWLAQQTLNRKSVDLTKITGASRPLIMGGVYYAS